MKSSWNQTFGRTLVFVALYVLIGNARSIELNPFIDGAVIAVYMVVPVIAGLLFGARVGLLVGLIGTAVNAGVYRAYAPDRMPFEALAILPHGVMGFSAGWLRGLVPTPFIAATIYIGHALNIIAFLGAGYLTFDDVSDGTFWLGLLYEGAIEMMTIIIMVTVYRLGFREPRA